MASLCILFCISCKTEYKIPPVISSAAEAKKIITGKTWKLTDAATVAGSRKSVFDENKEEKITPPSPASLNWFSTMKSIDTASDFIGKFYKKTFDEFKKISIRLTGDTLAATTGLMDDYQKYTLTEAAEDDKSKGIKIRLMKGSGDSYTIATYYVLGGDDQSLYLLSPNTINDLSVVFLLEAR